MVLAKYSQGDYLHDSNSHSVSKTTEGFAYNETLGFSLLFHQSHLIQQIAGSGKFIY